MEIPLEVKELLQTYDDNVTNVARCAVDIVSSFDFPVFNFLRDITPKNCLTILNCLDEWFGHKPTIDHCTCLMVLTEYISCAYNTTAFYETFLESKQDRFYHGLFVKLQSEWIRIFINLSASEFSSVSQFSAMLEYIRKSFNRFSQNFAFKWMLDDIIRWGKRCESRFESELEKPISLVQEITKNKPISLTVSNVTVTDITKNECGVHKKLGSYNITKFMVPKTDITHSVPNPPMNEAITIEDENSPVNRNLSTELPKKKLNAFDILMRKSIKKKSLS